MVVQTIILMPSLAVILTMIMMPCTEARNDAIILAVMSTVAVDVDASNDADTGYDTMMLAKMP